MTVKAELRVNAQGAEATAASFDRIGKAVQGMGGAGSRVSKLLSRDLGQISSAAKMAYGAIGGIGVAAGTSKVLDFVGQLAAIQVKTRKSNDEMLSLKNHFIGVSEATKQGTEGLTAAWTAMERTSRSAVFASENLKTVGDTARAIGADPSQIQQLGALAGVLGKVFGLKGAALKSSLGTFAAQGRAGTDLGEILPGLTEALLKGGSKGLRGAKGAERIGALYQFAGEKSGDVAPLLKALQQRSMFLKKGGIKVFDPKTNEMRDIPTIMLELFRRVGGSRDRMGAALGGRGAELGGAFLDQYDPKTRKWRTDARMEAFEPVKGSAGEIDESIKLRSQGIGKPLAMKNKAKKWLERQLLDYGIDVMGFVGENPALVAELAIGGGIALKAKSKIAALFLGKGKKGAGEALGGLGVQHVWVDGGQLGGLGGASGAPGAAAGKMPLLTPGGTYNAGGGAKGSGRTAGLLAVAYAGYEAYKQLSKSKEQVTAEREASAEEMKSTLRARALAGKRAGWSNERIAADVSMASAMNTPATLSGSVADPTPILRSILDELKRGALVEIKPPPGFEAFVNLQPFRGQR